MVSSPHYLQSNGHTATAVMSVKHLILKVALFGNTDGKDFEWGLLELCNTSNHTKHSPAQVLYERLLCSCIPPHPQSF